MKNTAFIAFVALGAASLTTGAALAKQDGARAPIGFEELDANSDGQITREEMNALRQDRFSQIDSNGDGVISLEELEAHGQERVKKHAERMIERRDANGDGVLTIDEMKSDKRADRRFDRIDGDGDGSISKAEFEAAKDKMERRKGKSSKN